MLWISKRWPLQFWSLDLPFLKNSWLEFRRRPLWLVPSSYAENGELGIWDNPGFFCSKAFSWIIFCVTLRSIKSSTCWQKELNWIYFSSFHFALCVCNYVTLGYLNLALKNPALDRRVGRDGWCKWQVCGRIQNMDLACEQALHLGAIVKSRRARGTQGETRIKALARPRRACSKANMDLGHKPRYMNSNSRWSHKCNNWPQFYVRKPTNVII